MSSKALAAVLARHALLKRKTDVRLSCKLPAWLHKQVDDMTALVQSRENQRFGAILRSHRLLTAADEDCEGRAESKRGGDTTCRIAWC